VRLDARVANLLMRLLVSAAALGVATWLISGIRLAEDTTSAKIVTLLGVAVVFGLVNMIVKPVVTLIGLPFFILTLGLLYLVVNGLLFWLSGWIAEELGLAFEVEGFWSGFFGAIVVAVVTWLLNLIIPDAD
jgi:putative membrane protein